MLISYEHISVCHGHAEATRMDSCGTIYVRMT